MEAVAALSNGLSRVHEDALRFLSPASLASAGDDERSKAHALINLQLAFLAMCLLFSTFLVLDGALLTGGGFVVTISLCFYLSNLLIYRWRGNLYVSAVLLLVYFEHSIMVKAYLEGLRSEAFFWAILLPQLVFFLLGQRYGAFFLMLALLHTLLLYAFHCLPASSATVDFISGRADELLSAAAAAAVVTPDGLGAAVRMMSTAEGGTNVSTEMGTAGGCSSSPWLAMMEASEGRAESPHHIYLNRIALIVFVGSFAFFHENRRSLALRQMEDALREKEAVNASLLQATEAKTNFLANMSHELRTPMHGIIAMASDLKEMPLPSKAREAIGIISDCADHLLSLVNDVLDFARIEQSQLELEQIPFCMPSEVKKALAMHSVIAKQKGVYLLVKKVRVSFPYHIGDPLRFRQIIINLLSNAIKFTPGGGQVSVSVVNRRGKPDFIRVSVQDTGIGIPKSSQPHLFESFSQLDASVRRKYGGSGLGLSICKKLCEAMGGEIECCSEVGKGSDFSFFVRLPPTTKQNYREAREGDEGDHSGAAATRQHGHRNHRHPLRTPSSEASASEEQKRTDDDDDEELFSDFDSDRITDDEDHGSDSVGDDESEDGSDDSDDDISTDVEEEEDEEDEVEEGSPGPPAVMMMTTKSLTTTPTRRLRPSNGTAAAGRDRLLASASSRLRQSVVRKNKNGGHVGQQPTKLVKNGARRASSPAAVVAGSSVVSDVDSNNEGRRRMSAGVAGSGGQYQPRRGSTNAGRASEGVRGLYSSTSSGPGYTADDDVNPDDWHAGSSLLTSASSSFPFSPSASSSALSSPSSSFCSSSEMLPVADRQHSGHSSLSHAEFLSTHSDGASYASPALAGLRRGSVPALAMSPSHRLFSSPALSHSSGGHPHHASMPIIPSLSSASDSPLPSPSLQPFSHSTSAAAPPPSPSFSSSSSSFSWSSSATSAQHYLPYVASRHLSLNSCASPRGVSRVRTSPPRPGRGDGQSGKSAAAANIVQLSIPKIPRLPLRSFYVPSFPSDAALLSPRSGGDGYHATGSSSGVTSPRSSGEEIQDVLRYKRILVVEDNVINQKVALKMLSSFECKVTVAENGLVAIKLLEESYRERRHENGEPLFHAILMDIQMPVIDGFETAIRIRELEAHFNEAEARRQTSRQLGPAPHQVDNNPKQSSGPSSSSTAVQQQQQVPIIALTASATKEYRQKCLAKGMNCFLSKPLKKETLARTLADVIKQAGYYDEAVERARRRAEEESARERQRQIEIEEAELRRRMQRQREIEELRERRKARERATIMMILGMRPPPQALPTIMAGGRGGGGGGGGGDLGVGADYGDDHDGELARRRMIELLRTKGRSRHVKHNSIG